MDRMCTCGLTTLPAVALFLLTLCVHCKAGMDNLSAHRIIITFNVHCTCFRSDFAEVPSSVTTNVSENQNALFRCRHERTDAIISWLVNGNLSTRYSDVIAGSIRENNGTFVDTLTIPTIPVYNGTEVVCVATVISDDDSTSEKAPPVMLIISGLYTMIHVCILLSKRCQ